jgi:hypothetical protein
LNNHRGTSSKQFSDPKWKAAKGADLTFKFYCTQPQKIIIVANGRYEKKIDITASNDWQSLTIPADQIKNINNKSSLGEWSQAASIQLKPQKGSDITKVIFADFKWIEK